MAGAARARVTSAAEASGCLVAPPVFKTGGRRFASPAGSIPVRLRSFDAAWEWPPAGGVGSRLWTRAVTCREPTSCSPTPAWSRRGSCWAGRWSRRRSPAPRSWLRSGPISPASVADAAAASLPPAAATLTPVINATGVLVHTNLGRAPLSAAARDAVRAAAGCTDVEFDLASGKRGRRGAGALDALARAVPAAGAVHVVNNNAAALALAATALAAGREIIVSRGELIEIGDGFRLPDLLQSTGARIREVGTTNRTTLADYRQAIGDGTAFILKVHPSNYLIEGFTSSVSVGELAGLGVLVVGDIGSGLLGPNPVLPDEPDADSWLRAGAGLVTASGDKLLGGPQAGLLLGQAGDGYPPRAPSAGPGAAGGQADPGRARGHPHRPGCAGHRRR